MCDIYIIERLIVGALSNSIELELGLVYCYNVFLPGEHYLLSWQVIASICHQKVLGTISRVAFQSGSEPNMPHYSLQRALHYRRGSHAG